MTTTIINDNQTYVVKQQKHEIRTCRQGHDLTIHINHQWQMHRQNAQKLRSQSTLSTVILEQKQSGQHCGARKQGCNGSRMFRSAWIGIQTQAGSDVRSGQIHGWMQDLERSRSKQDLQKPRNIKRNPVQPC